MPYQRRTKDEVKAEVNKLSEQAKSQIAKFETSFETRKEFFDFMSDMYNYSPRNQMLIHSQYKGATAVAPFNYWKDQGFSVRKGEHAIKILVPKTVTLFRNNDGDYKQLSKATPQEKIDIQMGKISTSKKQYFSLGSVFDMTQTNAKPEDYPDIYPNRPYVFDANDSRQVEKIKQGLLNIASDLNVPVYEKLADVPANISLGAAKGVFFETKAGTSGIVLSDRISEAEKIPTLTHELAHATLHGSKNLGNSEYWTTATIKDGNARNIEELQAEMVSYVVNKHSGIDTSEESIPYMSGWTKGIDMSNKEIDIFKDIQKTSADFIKKIDDSMALGKGLQKSEKAVMSR